MGWDHTVPPYLPPKWMDEISDRDGFDKQTQYPSAKTVAMIMIALYLTCFLVGLDRTIIATAVPSITDHFHSLGDVGWYGSSYLITGAAFQLLFGRIYTFYSPKWVFLSALVIFEAGSALCGAAFNSTTFIIGRAVAGLGSAGIFSGAVVIIAYCVPLRMRPLYGGFVAAIFGISSVAGPLLGGVLTQKTVWRWCFYINLPTGGAALLVIFFLFDIPSSVKSKSVSIKEKAAQLDPFGMLCFLPGIVSLFLALQWGGTVYSWGSGHIFTLLVISGILISCFAGIQIWQKENATIPSRIVMQRSIVAGIWFSYVGNGSFILVNFFLQIWFQAIKNFDVIQSGIASISMVLSVIVGAVISGGLVTAIGYYTPFMIASTVLMCIGAGLITTFTTDIGHDKWIGYQILFGFGFGLGVQQPFNATQIVLSLQDMPTGTSLMFFAQLVGGAVFISVGQNIFANHLVSGVATMANVNASIIVNTGATTLRNIVHDPASLRQVLMIYNYSLVNVFRVVLGLACVSILGGLAMEWKSVKEKNDDGD